MSGRIETFDSRKEQTSKWSQNEAFSVREAGVDIGKSVGQGGSNVSVDQVVTSGREVAGVTVDGERTPILIPNAGEWTQSDWAEADPSDDAYIKNKPSLAQVATSGDYGDLSNTPDLSDFVEDPNYVHTDNNYDIGAKNIVDHVTDDLAGKVDKVSGKQLSDNNFTNAQKDKLTNLADIYGIGSNLTLDPETNILSANAQPITIDDEMSSSSTNAVQNRVITSALGDKVDKVTGKVLSDNNYTTAEKEKLAGIDQGAEVNDISSITVNGTRINPDQDKNVNITLPVNTLYADAPIGSISPFGGTTVPDGYFLCNGQAISRTVYSDLFSVIGTSFGPGDGSTTFNVPDLRGEFIRGAGNNSHANQGNGGTVGAHQDATYQPSVMCSSSSIGCLDSNLDGDNNSVRDQDKNVTRTPSGVVSGQTQTITKYQVSGSRGTTSSTEIGFYARPTNTSVNFIIKAMHSSMPIDVVDYVDDAIDDAFATLATVATSGSYADLSNTPDLNTFDSDDFTVTNNEVSIIPAQRIFTGTQAQWNSLTLAEKKSYGQANITDDGSGGGGSGGNEINYSTNEQVIGTWIDGKPMYQKTIAFKSDATSGGVANVSIGESVDYIHLLCAVIDNSWGNFIPLNSLSNDATKSGVLGMRNYAHATAPNTITFTTTLDSWLDKWVYATIQYTKTTD